MTKSLTIFLGLSGLILATTGSALAQTENPAAEPHLLSAVLLLLLPLGLLLLTSSAMPETQAPATAVLLLLTWSLASLAYFLVGFAFNFGGIAQVSPHPEFSGLYWEWYPLDQSVDVAVARLWGLIAFQGWALAGEAATPAVFRLFAGHLALVGLAALIPGGVLLHRARPGTALLTGLLMGGLLYPLGGNWLWGGGWLANLGGSLGLGHGFVDFAGGSVIFLAGSIVALLALRLFESPLERQLSPPPEVIIPLESGGSLTVYPEPEPESVETVLPVTPMPSAYLPLFSVLGAGFMLMGWFGLASGLHAPTASSFSPGQAAVGGVLAALAGALAAAGYSWFTTQAFNPLMTSRGLVAGLVLAAAGAPFIAPGLLMLAGLGLGLALPPLIYLFNQRLLLADELGTLPTFGISAVLGLVLVGLLADGRGGQGWNGIGLTEFHGVAGQGVSGVWVEAAFAANWPGQLQAQLVGIAAIMGLAVIGSLLLFQTIKVVLRSWADTGLELADSRKPAPQPPEPAEPEAEGSGS